MNDALIERRNATVGPTDDVIVPGDFTIDGLEVLDASKLLPIELLARRGASCGAPRGFAFASA